MPAIPAQFSLILDTSRPPDTSTVGEPGTIWRRPAVQRFCWGHGQRVERRRRSNEKERW